MFADLKFALRRLARTPGFTAIAVLMLALGIGATTTVFSWVDRVLLHPLPGTTDPARIVALETRGPSGGLIDTSFPDYLDYRAQARSFSQILVFKERPLNLGSGAEAQRIWSELVSGNFFDALGVRPRLGRFFTPADRADEDAAAPVVVISESLWRRQFGARSDVLGRVVKLNQHSFTVIGVAPAAFLGSLNGLAFDAWVPIGAHESLIGMTHLLETRNWRALHTLGRLAPGATLASAQAELATISARLAAAHPDTNRGISLAALPLARSPHGAQGSLGKPLLLLLGVSGLILFIVAANLANLLLVRAASRQREICIRQALGARASQLVRQLVAESLLLCVAGTALGLLATLWMSDLLAQFIPDSTLPISLTASVDPNVILVAAGIATLTTLLAGLAPALWATRGNVVEILRTGSRVADLTPRAELFRRLLVVAQVAVAFVTLACAALAAKSFEAAKHADPGFDPDGVLLAGLKFDTSGYTVDQAQSFLDRLHERLAGQPGVASVAYAENVPLGLSRGSWEELSIPGYVPGANEDMRIYRNLISPGYLALMHTPLIEGRDFTDADRSGSPYVAIVNETFARRYFGTTEAIGRTFSIWGGRRTLTVVGVAKDTKIYSLSEPAAPYYYVSLRQFLVRDTGVALHVRTAAPDPMSLLPAVRAAARAVDPNVPIFEALSLADYVSAARFAQKAAASLLGLLSAIALGLSSLGLYGVLAFAIAQRVPEIGLRLALGAQPGDISRLFLGRGTVLLGIGLACGLAIAIAVTRGIAALFYGLDKFEPALLGLTMLPVALCALAAAWIPSRRAARVDPLVALRAE